MLQRRLSFGDFGLVSDGWIAAELTDTLKFENANKKSLRDGEERLMTAVLEDAVMCFQEYVLSTRPREKRLFQEAEDWFLDKESDYVFSFEFICETLGFYPDHIRRGLMTWKEARRKMVASPEANQRTARIKRTRYLPRHGRVARAG